VIERAEIGVAIGGAQQPVVPERRFDAAADGPADQYRVGGTEDVGRSEKSATRRRRDQAGAKNALLDVLPSYAAGAVQQHVRRNQIAGARAHTAVPVHIDGGPAEIEAGDGGKSDASAGNADDALAAVDRVANVGFHPDDPSPVDLVVVAEIAADVRRRCAK
jgi:hypothetical protein